MTTLPTRDKRTGMNYNETAAGQEIDRLVAEQVMGWTRDKWVETDGWEAGMTMTGHWKEAPGYYRFVFKPSTNIAHAWAVWERLWETASSLTLFQAGSDYEITLTIPDAHDCAKSVIVRACGKTAPLVICRVALLATHSETKGGGG